MIDSRLLRANSLVAEAIAEDDEIAVKYLLSEAEAEIRDVLDGF